MNFEESCAALRPDLHRFCTRMTGTAWDGEDVVHEALATALGRRDELREAGSLRSWLFRIAHTKCIDFLRARRPTEELEDAEDDMARPDDDLDDKRRVERALASLATELPAKERAAVMLKDVLDCSLEETAEITSSNVGAVKAALHRGREKLREADARPRRVEMPPEVRRLVQQYITAFNRRDWDGVRALVAEDARLEVVDRTETRFLESRYLTNYAALPVKWRLEFAFVDGEECVVHYREIDGVWRAHAVVTISVRGDSIHRVRDYLHVDSLLRFSDVSP